MHCFRFWQLITFTLYVALKNMSFENIFDDSEHMLNGLLKVLILKPLQIEV